MPARDLAASHGSCFGNSLIGAAQHSITVYASLAVTVTVIKHTRTHTDRRRQSTHRHRVAGEQRVVLFCLGATERASRVAQTVAFEILNETETEQRSGRKTRPMVRVVCPRLARASVGVCVCV